MPQTTGYDRVCQLFAEVWRLNSWNIVAILRKRKRCTLKVALLCPFSAWNGTLFLIFIQQNDLFRGKLQSVNWWKIWSLPQAGQTKTSTVVEIILRNCFVLFMSNGLLKKLARMCLNVGLLHACKGAIQRIPAKIGMVGNDVAASYCNSFLE